LLLAWNDGKAEYVTSLWPSWVRFRDGSVLKISGQWECIERKKLTSFPNIDTREIVEKNRHSNKFGISVYSLKCLDMKVSAITGQRIGYVLAWD
jgi:hypothetical protein